MQAEELASQALDWLVGAAEQTPAGTGWKEAASEPEVDQSLYAGAAGIILALLEAHRHFGDDPYADLALSASRALADGIERDESCGLYGGLTGTAVSLRAVAGTLGDAASAAAADRALGLVRSRFDGERWSEFFELLEGNAGIGLGALAAGDIELAVLAVSPYIDRAEHTAAGVNWEVRTATESRLHHISHGTLGIVMALAAVGGAADRPDLVELALAGAADVLSRNEGGPDHFLVPHSDPQFMPELVERFSYGWCHGPAGDAQVFRLLDAQTGDPMWRELGVRCWHSVTESGLPRRLRPGFWDNVGRCCGTAGVLATALDRIIECGDDAGFANVLVDDLRSLAIVDETGTRWSNEEFRADPSALEPHSGWGMGNAGIIRELLRFVRVSTGGDPGYAVDWPDHLAVRPAPLS
jgi:hypothetical protein